MACGWSMPRGQAQGTEILLKAADVVLADAEVMEEVAGAAAMAGFNFPSSVAYACSSLMAPSAASRVGQPVSPTGEA